MKSIEIREIIICFDLLYKNKVPYKWLWVRKAVGPQALFEEYEKKTKFLIISSASDS